MPLLADLQIQLGLSRGPCSMEQKRRMLAAGPFGSCQC